MQAVVGTRPATTVAHTTRTVASARSVQVAKGARGLGQQQSHESMWRMGQRVGTLSAAILVSARAAARAARATSGRRRACVESCASQQSFVSTGAHTQGVRLQRPTRGAESRSFGSRAARKSSPAEAPAQRPKVRFAPSPTGVLHVGGARTALFNWLFAKSQGGDMVLRVEDTDMARSTAESEAAILEGLKWCGITWDEGPDIGGDSGPYRQSERIEAGIYKEQLQKLIDGGHAYKCFLTPEELDAMRAEAERNEQAFVVQSIWATASEEQIQAMLDEGKPYVYRFRVPMDEEIVVDDLVLGEVEWSTDDVGGDFVIVRQTGVPMYNFGVVVDDALMGITHVFRAQEHLMNTPKQILIYQALGLPVPQFGHMPLILAPDRSKLSKRHGAVSVGDYQKDGYLASGMINYLSQLGWNDGTNKEIYNLDELVEAFTMNRMSKVAAIFDKDKFKWVNGHHVRLLDDEKAVEMIGSELVRQGLIKEAAGDFAQQASLLLRDRISTLVEAGDELRSMMAYDIEGMLAAEKFQKYVEDGAIKETAKCIIDAYNDGHFDAIGEDPNVFKTLAKTISEKRGGVKKKALLAPLRLCLTGTDNGPDMAKFFTMLSFADDNVMCDAMPLSKRIELLQEKLDLHSVPS